MTGTEGEQWPIPIEKFKQTYDDLGDGTAAKKNIPVFAKEMGEPFSSKSVLVGRLVERRSGRLSGSVWTRGLWGCWQRDIWKNI